MGLNERYDKYSSPVQIPGTTWSHISGGDNATFATKTDGTAWVWGYGYSGQLGLNNLTQYSSPVQLPGTTWSHIDTDKDKNIVALKTDGTLWAWGRNDYGSLGLNQTYPSGRLSSPTQIPGTDWVDNYISEKVSILMKEVR